MRQTLCANTDPHLAATYYRCDAVGERRNHTGTHQGNPKLDQRIQYRLHVSLEDKTDDPRTIVSQPCTYSPFQRKPNSYFL